MQLLVDFFISQLKPLQPTLYSISILRSGYNFKEYKNSLLSFTCWGTRSCRHMLAGRTHKCHAFFCSCDELNYTTTSEVVLRVVGEVLSLIYSRCSGYCRRMFDWSPQFILFRIWYGISSWSSSKGLSYSICGGTRLASEAVIVSAIYIWPILLSVGESCYLMIAICMKLWVATKFWTDPFLCMVLLLLLSQIS